MFPKDICITKFENILKDNFIKGKVTPSWKRPFSGIIIILKGRFEFNFSDNTVIVDEQHPIFIPEGVTYNHICKEDAESIVFNFRTLNAYDKKISLTHISPVIVKEYYNKINSLINSNESCQYAILSALYEFFSQAFFETDADISEIIVRKAERIMNENYGDSTLTNRKIADMLNISEVYLRKLFAKKRKISPGKALSKIRMQKATKFLEQGKPVGDVAICCGYSDIFQFSRAFKNYYSYPPSSVTKKVPFI